MSVESNGCRVPLLELLDTVPEHCHQMIEVGACHHRNIPYGRYCKEAAARIRELEIGEASNTRNRERLEDAELALRQICVDHLDFDPQEGEGTAPQEIVEMLAAEFARLAQQLKESHESLTVNDDKQLLSGRPLDYSKLGLPKGTTVSVLMWTKEKPKVSGWYWCWNVAAESPAGWLAVVRLDVTVRGHGICTWLTEPGKAAMLHEAFWAPSTQWMGPILEPPLPSRD